MHRVLTDGLAKYLNEEGKYNGIIRLISPGFLKISYAIIKSNPGNMSPGSTPETLDGINER